MMTKRKISIEIVSALLTALLAASGFVIYRELSSRQKEKEDFEDLAKIVTALSTEPSETDTPDNESDAEIKPEQTGRNLAELFAMNGDCIGWLCIPDTSVNYPVMHTPENPQKYLRKNFYAEYSQSGVPFLDGRCDTDSGNLILYGHNMKNGTMFSDLRKYINSAFREEHSVIEFQIADGSRFYTVTEVRITDIYDEWYLQLDTDMHYLTLSACYGSSKSCRILVIAKEVETFYENRG